MEAPPKLMRGEDVLEIPLGTVLMSKKEVAFVFVGWRATTSGCEVVFVQAYRDRETTRRSQQQDNGDPWTYKASMADTLIRKFPALAWLDQRKPAETTS